MSLRHRAAVITAVAGIALTGLATAGPAMAATTATVKAAAGAPASTITVDGTISALNALKSTLSVAGVSGTKSSVTVAPNAAVTLDGDTSRLAKLPLGANVKLSGTVTNGSLLATKVDATVPLPFVSAGSVATVNATARTISITKVVTGATSVYPVADKAVISLDGRTVALSALPAKANILVTGTVTAGTYSAKTLTAVSRWSLNLNGTVSAVDAVNGTVTVNTGSPAAAVKLNVDPKATIKLNGVKVSLANLPIGATVGLTGTETTAGATIAGIDAKAKLR